MVPGQFDSHECFDVSWTMGLLAPDQDRGYTGPCVIGQGEVPPTCRPLDICAMVILPPSEESSLQLAWGCAACSFSFAFVAASALCFCGKHTYDVIRFICLGIVPRLFCFCVVFTFPADDEERASWNHGTRQIALSLVAACEI